MVKMDSDRLKRWKCLYCGCKDKNILNYKSSDACKDEDPPSVKIVTCENCGHTDLFAVSATVAAQFIKDSEMDREGGLEFKRQFHIFNHNMPSAMKPYLGSDKTGHDVKIP